MENEIGLSPHMDQEGLVYFKEKLNKSQCYLEYGSGASTLYAAIVAKVPSIISVDSDRNWCEKVEKSIHNNKRQIYIDHCDIGEVGAWGKPVNHSGVSNYWQYAFQPWRVASEKKLVPDTILIDGRFRVVSFLVSLLNSRIGTYILFDDYLNRPEYFVVEQFCNLESKHGRMGVFVSHKNFSQSSITQAIAKYSVIWA
jgi:hypothetical protein